MTAVDAAVRPTKATVRSRMYLAKLLVMTRPPKFVAACIGQQRFRFTARAPQMVSSTFSNVSSEAVAGNKRSAETVPALAGFDFPGISCDGTGMPIEVKICGLSSEDSVDAALEAGADFVGFNFFPPSPRYVSLERAAALAVRVRGKAQIVAITVDGDDSLLGAIASALRPDFLQLHGRESPQRVAAIRAMTDVPVMKALGVAAEGDLAAISSYAIDRLLLDAKPPRDATRPGGHGTVFDWSVLEGFSATRPWFLSGGLEPGNVAEALRATRAPGVDVSSGVESAPGKKDPARIHAFVEAVRAFDPASAHAATKERAA